MAKIELKNKKGLHCCKPFWRLDGSPTWARTRDPMINSHLLYQLSYRGSLERCDSTGMSRDRQSL
jgi:hypothetical protein